MQVIPADYHHTLFSVADVVPWSLQEKILNTPWLDLPWQREKYQEHWSRRKVDDSLLPWIDEWHSAIEKAIDKFSQTTRVQAKYTFVTAWWVDEPGFTVDIHTDGGLPGSMQIFWIGQPNLATEFYYDQQAQQPRLQQQFVPNTGYIMLNIPSNKTGEHVLAWHGMPNPVPENEFRLCSYSQIQPLNMI